MNTVPKSFKYVSSSCVRDQHQYWQSLWIKETSEFLGNQKYQTPTLTVNALQGLAKDIKIFLFCLIRLCCWGREVVLCIVGCLVYYSSVLTIKNFSRYYQMSPGRHIAQCGDTSLEECLCLLGESKQLPLGVCAQGKGKEREPRQIYPQLQGRLGNATRWDTIYIKRRGEWLLGGEMCNQQKATGIQ